MQECTPGSRSSIRQPVSRADQVSCGSEVMFFWGPSVHDCNLSLRSLETQAHQLSAITAHIILPKLMQLLTIPWGGDHDPILSASPELQQLCATSESKSQRRILVRCSSTQACFISAYTSISTPFASSSAPSRTSHRSSIASALLPPPLPPPEVAASRLANGASPIAYSRPPIGTSYRFEAPFVLFVGTCFVLLDADRAQIAIFQ
jgi:hypothetical protein